MSPTICSRNVNISWGLILAPNILCIVGVFTLGFGIAASVLTNNVAALGALANGVRPMRKGRRARGRAAASAGVAVARERISRRVGNDD